MNKIDRNSKNKNRKNDFFINFKTFSALFEGPRSSSKRAENNMQCSQTDENINFRIFIFLVMIDFVHNFQVFSQTKNGKIMIQKIRNFLKRIFELMIFFVQILVMVNFVFYLCNAFRT